MTDMTPINKNTRKYFQGRKGAMDLELSSFISHYKDLSQFVQPRRGRFLVDDVNKGQNRHNNIINNTATQALRIASAGMAAGIMSPATPWFSLGTFNPADMDKPGVRQWLENAETLMFQIFDASNLYKMAPTMFSELIQFGTGAMSQVEDFDTVARFYTHTVGSYTIAQNERLDVDTFCRQYKRTASQMIEEFGKDKVSDAVKSAYNAGHHDQLFDVVHFIEPNPDFKPDSFKSKQFRSIKYEPSESNNSDSKFLSEGGFNRFQTYVPRWETTAEDIYGTNCPGMVALGDVKGLQIEERRKAQGIDKMVNPPLTGPPSLKNVPVSSLPGGLTTYDGDPNGNQLRPIYSVNPQINALVEDMDRVEARIKETYFVDLFLAITNMRGIQPRNELEISERNAERLLQLGPVLQSVQGEFLAPLIDNTFATITDNELLPEAPEALQGSPLKVNYISTLARAQKSVELGGIEGFAGFIGNLHAAGNENAWDKFDADASIDAYGDAIGVPTAIIVPTDEAQETREKRAEELARQQQLADAQSQANTAKLAADAKLGDDSVLSRAAGA